MGSLTLSSLNFNTLASINTPKLIQDLATVMNEKWNNTGARSI